MNKDQTRRLLGTALPAVLLLGAVGGGLAYTKHTVDSAVRTAPRAEWMRTADEPGKDPAGDVFRGKDSTELSKLLLPVPDNFRLGPDISSYGNDSELSGAKAEALLKEQGRGVSGKQRREYEKQIDRLGVRGIAVRSYTAQVNNLVVEVQIVRMKNTKQIHALYALRTELAGLLGSRKGPKIKGHKKAACFMAPPSGTESDEATELGGMACTAYDDELLVSVTASGTNPFDKRETARLVKDQLDHVVSPGEYI
ncbi:hypothetical protein [Streptomyces sp. ISL-100]|uniref:hypothetical protein n=1 Tax=Streptomyces sp. ISL-100 TaxID=2819173 RepID=UPI001BEA2B7E|nr:hypothetical protein [Streptomyces sp. ISL-100]MBT2401086.1 hypothetical protein [Streptomyces sp. ISL-100]